MMPETQLCQTLLAEIETLPADQALQRIKAFFEQHTFKVGPSGPTSETWILLQDIRYREGELALTCDLPNRCVEALQHCEWRDADKLEAKAAQSALAATEFGAFCQLARLKSGGFQVWTQDGDTVRTGRLSSDLTLELTTGPIPKAAHEEFQELRDMPKSDKTRQAELFAKTAVKLHAGGRSEAALGLLELALAEGLEHRALVPSRQALLDKGFTPDSSVQAWRQLYSEPLGSGRGRARVTQAQGAAQRQQRLREAIPSAYHWSKSEGAQTLLAATDAELREIRNDKLLAFLAVTEPKRAKKLLEDYEGPATPDLVASYLACGDESRALQAVSTLTASEKFATLANITERRGLSGLKVKARKPKAFLPAALEAARQLVLGGEAPDPETPLAWLAKHDPGHQEWLEANRENLPHDPAPVTSQAQFEAEFGPLAPWPYPADQDIVSQVNLARNPEAPLLDGHLTTWGWSSGDEKDTDWNARAEAWRLALKLQRIATAGGLILSSESDAAYAPLAARWQGAAGLKGVKATLGIGPDELAEECALDKADLAEFKEEHGRAIKPAERLAYELFFGTDAISEGPETYYDDEQIAAAFDIAKLMHQHLKNCCKIRFDRTERTNRYVVAPVLLVGRTPAGYLCGLFSLEVRT